MTSGSGVAGHAVSPSQEAGGGEFCCLAGFLVFLLFIQFGVPDGATHIQGGSSPLGYTSLEGPSPAFPEVCLLGDAKASLYNSEDEL